MPEPNGAKPTEDTTKAASERFAVFEMIGGEKALLIIIAMLRNEAGDWILQCSGPSQSAIDRVRPHLERYSSDRRAAGEAESADTAKMFDLSEAITLLEREGFIVENVPAADHQVEIQIDLESGTLVGSHTALHELMPSDDSLGRRVVETIAKGFSKASDDLVTEIDISLDKGDYDSAIKVVKRATDLGILSLPPSNKLLSSLLRFDVSALSAEGRSLIRRSRVILADRLRRYEVASADADALLAEDGETLSAEHIAAFKTTVALGAISRGHRETGLSMLHDLLKSPSALDAEGRGWVWRNIALASEMNAPEARRAAQLSADAFLQAGNKREAGKSLLCLVDILMREDPNEAVMQLDEMIGLLDREGLLDRHVRAAALHARANRLLKLNRHSEAYRDACEAVTLRRGLLGADSAFVSSLHLAALEACYVGDGQASEALEKEAEKLAGELNLSHFRLAQRLSELGRKFDSKAAENLLSEAKAAHNLEMIVAVRVYQATLDESLRDTARLQMLEETRDQVVAARGDAAILTLIKMAIGHRLVQMGLLERAEGWFGEILAVDPLDGIALNYLIDCLWRQEKWGDAAILLRKQLTLRGELPGLTFVLGKSLFEAGDLSGAIPLLSRVINWEGADENLRRNAAELRERALQKGGTVLPTAPAPPVGAVTREEFEAALDDFAGFVAAEKRKSIRINSNWLENPESRAKDLLHTFLKARLGERVDIFTEIDAGAGRIDLYVKLEGGLSVIIELKLCGAPYSTSYAASGEQQIQHYMDNRKTNLGYLVVFDARVDLFGTALVTQCSGPHTVIEKIVDVRSKVKK